MVDVSIEKLADSYFIEGNLHEAEPLYMNILSNDPQNRIALYRLAYICAGKLDFANAELFLNALLKIGADVEALLLFAYVNEKQDKLYDAIVMYERAIELRPEEGLYERVCKLYVSLELYEQALGTLEEYIQKYPTISAYRQLFVLYLNLSKKKELTDLIKEIQEKFKNDGIAYNLLGMYKEFIEFDYDEAEKLYQKSLKLGNVIAGHDLALLLKKQRRYDEAEKYCKKILNTYPRKDDIIQILANIYLSQRKMRKGFKYYLEHELPDFVKSLKNPWDGKSCLDKTLLVYCDCHDSDAIRNLRFVDEAKKKFKKIIIACSEDLEYLLKANKYNVVQYKDLANVKYDKYVLISELLYYLNNSFENIPKCKLDADIKNLDGDFKVGILWKIQGDSYKVLNEHSIELTDGFADLFNMEGVTYYSLQKNDIWNTLEKYPQIIDLSSNMTNLYETASFINSMDLIISVDTEIVHIAGLLGVPTCVIIPEDAGWYWFDNDNKTEWYSSVNIMRINNRHDTDDISKRLIEKVNNGKHQKVK